MDIGRTWTLCGSALVNEIEETLLPDGEIALWNMGQLGVVIKTHDLTIGIDLVLTDLVENGTSVRYYPAPFEPDQLKLDLILCTHGHGDHMCIPTLLGLHRKNPDTPIYVPAGCVSEALAGGLPASALQGLNAGALLELPGVVIRTVQAAHPVHTVDTDGNDVALSYHLELNGAAVLHTGDSYLTDQLLKDYLALPRPDIYITPINGGDYFRETSGCIGNFNFMEAAHLYRLLKASLIIPMHFDMIRGNTFDPLPFIRILWEVEPSARFALPALGERILYRR